MNSHITVNEQALIEKILARMQAEPRKRGVPARKVRGFLANVGKEIERAGSLSKEYVDQLLLKIENENQ
jgi:hypothetical protein